MAKLTTTDGIRSIHREGRHTASSYVALFAEMYDETMVPQAHRHLEFCAPEYRDPAHAHLAMVTGYLAACDAVGAA